MKKIIPLIIFVLLSKMIIAQSPQFVVVRPDGTTFICPTFDSAYSKALNGDNIYLPGGTINGNFWINKRLNIYGAGHHPDSSIVTGRTTIHSVVYIDTGAVGGQIEGLNNPNYYVHFVYSNKKINGYRIKRCYFSSISLSGSGAPCDSFPSNIVIEENVVGSISFGNCSKNNIVSKNLIRNTIDAPSYSTIKNNTFLNQSFPLTGTIDNCTIENNVFVTSPIFSSNAGCSSNFYNNLKLAASPILTGCTNPGGIESGTVSVNSIADVFIAFNTSYSNYPHADNYRLKPTCPGINAGNDGTDVGIYGTTSPTADGWVPSNPHIYFKQVAPQTNASGQLPVQFKVRTNN